VASRGRYSGIRCDVQSLALLQRRIADGVVRPLNPVIAAQGFVGMIVDSLLLHEIYGIPRPADYSLEQAVETFVTLFCNGIRP
jgi:hypothetical protein